MQLCRLGGDTPSRCATSITRCGQRWALRGWFLAVRSLPCRPGQTGSCGWRRTAARVPAMARREQVSGT